MQKGYKRTSIEKSAQEKLLLKKNKKFQTIFIYIMLVVILVSFVAWFLPTVTLKFDVGEQYASMLGDVDDTLNVNSPKILTALFTSKYNALTYIVKNTPILQKVYEMGFGSMIYDQADEALIDTAYLALYVAKAMLLIAFLVMITLFGLTFVKKLKCKNSYAYISVIVYASLNIFVFIAVVIATAFNTPAFQIGVGVGTWFSFLVALVLLVFGIIMLIQDKQISKNNNK
ncbi:MAG: hypothetical protein RR454_00075 [Clostridia bacterium]